MTASDDSKWPLSLIQAWKKAGNQFPLNPQSPTPLPLSAYQQFIYEVWNQIAPADMDLSDLLKQRIEKLPSDELETLLRSMNAELSQDSRTQVLIAYFSANLGSPPDLNRLLEGIL